MKNMVRMSKPKVLSVEEADASIQPLMNLASAHFASQALNAIITLGIPDIIGNATMTIGDIASNIEGSTNEDALLRTMRLVSTVGILIEESSTSLDGTKEFSFSLSSTGALLQKKEVPGQPNLSPIFQHWMEQPLWNAWNELPAYILEGGEVPFDRSNGVSSDMYYGAGNPKSLEYANGFVRFISNSEESAVLDGFDWNSLSGKTLLDIGGHHGKMMGLLAKKYARVKFICLDLPEVVSLVKEEPPGVEIVAGNIFDSSTIPVCDAIFMKHFLDKCMWTEEESIQILKSCYSALPENGRVIIGEAVLPDNAMNADGINRMHLFIDVLFLLVGRDSARTQQEWTKLANASGFLVEKVTVTSCPSCYLIVLVKPGISEHPTSTLLQNN